MNPISFLSRKFKSFKIWWPLIVIVVLFFGTNIWVYPTLERLKENALRIQLDSAQIAKKTIDNFNSFHLFISLWDTASFLGLMPESKDAIISKLFMEQGHFLEAEIINDRGEIVAYYQNKGRGAEKMEPADNFSYSGSELFETISRSEIYTGSVTFKENFPYLTVAQPFFTNGIFSGALVLKSNLSFLLGKGSLSVLKIREGEEVYVVDSEGNLILHSGYAEQLPQIQIKERKVVVEISEGKSESVTGAYINENGERVQASAVQYKFLGWAVIAEEPASKVFAARNSTLFFALLTAAAQLLLMGLLARNILSLIRTAEDLRKSKAELEEAKSVLEIKVQARTKELQDLTHNLEEIVKNRTKDLRERIEELEEFSEVTVGRELKMTELKERIEKLEKENDDLRQKINHGHK